MPAERRSPPGADHLAVKEAEGEYASSRPSRCHRLHGGRRGPKGSCGGGSLGPRTRDSEVWPWRTLPTSLHSRWRPRMMSKTYDCDVMLCKCYVHQDCVNGGPSVRTRYRHPWLQGASRHLAVHTAVIIVNLTRPQLWSQCRLMLATNRS